MELPTEVESHLRIAHSAYNRSTWANLERGESIAYCETATAAYNAVVALLELELDARRAKRIPTVEQFAELFQSIQQAVLERAAAPAGEIEGARVGTPADPESSSHG